MNKITVDIRCQKIKPTKHKGVMVHISHGGGMGGSSYKRYSVKPLTKDENGDYVLTLINGDTMTVNPLHTVSKRNVKLVEFKNVVCGQSHARFHKTFVYAMLDSQEFTFGMNDDDKLTDKELGLEL